MTGRLATLLLPRHLHPVAWWIWALGLATAASRTANPLLLLLVVAVTAFVVAARRTDAPWARAYRTFLIVGLVVVALRVVFHVVFGSPIEGATVVAELPEMPLPDAFAGIRLGGDVTAEGLLAAAYEGLRLATLLICLGAANALANPVRLLRSVPGALYEVGVAVVVAMTFAPSLITSIARVRAARRLRGRASTGLRGLAGTAMPVLEGALERSLDLAAAMDSRGYGRRAGVAPAQRRLTAVLVLGGLLGMAAGSYGLLGADADGPAGLPLLAMGAAAATAGLALGGRRTRRSRYRPDRWAAPEWAVASAGVLCAVALLVVARVDPGPLTPSTMPARLPGLPLVPTLAILLGLAPAWLSPPAPQPVPTRRPVARAPQVDRSPVAAGRP